MSNPTPGWYPDSITPGQQRYWDGRQWTEHVAPLPQTSPPPYAGYGVPGYVPPAPAYAPPGNQGYQGHPGYQGAGYGSPAGVYAHWGQRVASYLLDALIAAPFFVGSTLVQGIHQNQSGAGIFATTAPTMTGGRLTAYWILYLAGIAITLWNVAYRQGTTGYSVGKQIVGIKLIREQDGQLLGGWAAFGRNVLHLLDVFSLGIGFLWPLWDPKKQTFADKVIRSVVVVEPKPKQ